MIIAKIEYAKIAIKPIANNLENKPKHLVTCEYVRLILRSLQTVTHANSLFYPLFIAVLRVIT